MSADKPVARGRRGGERIRSASSSASASARSCPAGAGLRRRPPSAARLSAHGRVRRRAAGRNLHDARRAPRSAR
jgi:hypothetical protein